MKTKNAILISLILAALTGCAGGKLIMVKDDGSPYDKRDDGACRAQAMSAQTSSWEYRGTIMEAASIQTNQRDIFKNCMIGRGYRVGSN